MSKIFGPMVVAIIGLAVACVGCSKESCDEAVERVKNAGKALSGDDAEQTPKIVREQQRKERKRQDSTWTLENQAKHPIEYCQAQLEKLDQHAVELDVTMHEVSVNQNKVKREMREAEDTIAQLREFLNGAKKSYKEAESSGNEKVSLGGFAVTKEKAKEKMVEAARKIPQLQGRIGTLKNFLVKLDKKAELVTLTQKKIVENRGLVQNTITNLKLKQVIDGEKGIGDVLNAINDSMSSLSVDFDNPTLEEIVQPANSATIDAEFEKLMKD